MQSHSRFGLEKNKSQKTSLAVRKKAAWRDRERERDGQVFIQQQYPHSHSPMNNKN